MNSFCFLRRFDVKKFFFLWKNNFPPQRIIAFVSIVRLIFTHSIKRSFPSTVIYAQSGSVACKSFTIKCVNLWRRQFPSRRLTCFAQILLKSSQRVINHDGYIVGCGAADFIPNAFRKIAQCLQRSRVQASRLIGKCGDLRSARLKPKQIFQESSLWSRTILNLLIHPQSAIDFSFFFNDRFRPNNKRKNLFWKAKCSFSENFKLLHFAQLVFHRVYINNKGATIVI